MAISPAISTPRTLALALLTLSVCTSKPPAVSQTAQRYPEKSIRCISPYPTSASQILALLVAEKLTAPLGQAVVVDFRPGTGGNIGMELAAKAPADGYTLVQASSSMAVCPSL